MNALVGLTATAALIALAICIACLYMRYAYQMKAVDEAALREDPLTSVWTWRVRAIRWQKRAIGAGSLTLVFVITSLLILA